MLALLLMLHSCNNMEGEKLAIFYGLDLYYGDACMLLHLCHWSEPQYNMLSKFCVHGVLSTMRDVLGLDKCKLHLSWYRYCKPCCHGNRW